MMRRINKGSLSVLLMSSSQKHQQGFVVPSQQPSKLSLLAIERLLVLSDNVGGGVCSPPPAAAAATAAMGSSRRFFHAGGGGGGGGGASSVKRDMFRAGGDTPILFSGWKTRGCVGGFVPHQCNISHMLPYFARALSSSSTSQSSGQTPRQEPTKKKECQIISSSKGQRETDDETSSTKVSLNQFPGIMAIQFGLTPPERVKKSKTRRLLRLNPGTGYFEEQQDVAAAANHHSHDELQVPYGHVCRGSAYGWLFLTDENFNMKLLNPFSGAEIQLPPVKTLPHFPSRPLSQWVVWKAVFSANPSVEPRPVVLVIYGPQFMAFCKPGDEGWTPLEFPVEGHHQHQDAIYHKGQFYVLSYPAYVAAFDIGRRIDDDDHSVKISLLAKPPKRGWIYCYDSYLVMVDGELVRVELKKRCFYDCCKERTLKEIEIERKRDGDTTDEDITTDDEEDYNDDEEFRCSRQRLCTDTYVIKIRRLDVSEKQWVKMESLGDKALFVGYNTSFALSASDYPAGVCIPDSIYFTYSGSGSEGTEKVCYDMGIYNVKNKTVKPLIYPPMPIDGVVKPAPIWIVNASCSDGKVDG